MKAKIIFTVLFIGLLTSSSFSQKIVWKPKKEIPNRIQAGNSVVLNDEIYLMGGQTSNVKFLDETYKYNPVTDTWLELANLPTAKINFAAVTYENRIYTIGGDLFINKNEMYDPITDTWQTKSPMPTARQNVDGCELNGIIYVLGGLESYEIVSDKVEAYDPTTDSWTSPTILPVPKHCTALASHNNEIYVMGGFKYHGNIWCETKSVEIYNVITNTWRDGTEMPEQRVQSRTIIYNNEIYIFGGWTRGDNGDFAVTNSVWIYNPETDNWRTSANIPLPVSTCGTTIVGNNIYLMGGFRDEAFYSLSENLEGTIIDSGNFEPELYYSLVDDSCVVNDFFYKTLPRFTFVDDDTLRYSASLANGNDLPNWLFFNNDDGLLTGTPEMEDTLTIIIKAIDNYNASVSDTFKLVVYKLVTEPNPTGINQFSNSDDLLIFPNPAINYIQVSVSDHNYKFENFQILTLDAKIIKEGRLESERINISDLNKGVFLLKIKTNERIITKKIIIK